MMQESPSNAGPVIISKKEYAEHRGCAPSYISKLIKQGKLTAPALTFDDRIDRDLADAQLSAQADPARVVVRKASSGPSFASEKAASEGLKRQKLEIELARSKEQLVMRDDVDRAAEEVARELRNRLLELPADVAPKLIGLDTEQAIIMVLKEAIVKALEQVSNDIQGTKLCENVGAEKGDAEP